MPPTKVIRVKRFSVNVFKDYMANPVLYVVYAVDQYDARLLAFALDGGFPYTMTNMEEGHVDLAMEYTKIVVAT